MGFLGDRYLLDSETAEELYADIESLPIVDPHTHADLTEIIANDGWSDIWEVEGATDHYVWSMMRKRGIPERKITGEASNKEKWLALASEFPNFAGNPSYEWIHLDLQRRFGIEKPISEATAEEIWTETKAQLATQSMRPQRLLEEMNVEVFCTTDDPTSTLENHERAERTIESVDIRPTWRLDRALHVGRDTWYEFVDQLEQTTGTGTGSFSGFLEALEETHDYFAARGCRASDLSLEQIVTRPVSQRRARNVYRRALEGRNLSASEVRDFQAFLIETVGRLNAEKGWVTQLHLGAVRNYRDQLYDTVGADAGGDVSTQSIELTDNLEYFLNEFDGETEIILYTVDPTHYPTITTIARAFPNVSVGPAWWFNDSPYGIEEQLQYTGSVDLLSNHAGMVSDSRKLISYGSRFEMFRRTLANVVGEMVDRERVPMAHAEHLVRHLAYDRPKSLYGF
ncbi:glucuronate isomerase [Haloterrigena sp. SYSU A121-1]|uniref:Uronate isomerase n=1 Tax=Haloterrigena gelatinilytica TaxID=2741724 RepID=A0A8J8KGT7_9EURY|nr:glucuronate isomerase [Haloterrigena gelatinilytica]NUB93778.1 glucuronate isomerase [Haloterrigena gelatinilytica]